MFNRPPPLSLYIHMPWCVSKCPYCDFNSHVLHNPIPEHAYLQALYDDFATHQSLIGDRPIISIFIGGGTPSLIAPDIIAALLKHLQQQVNFDKHIEITMEANPNSIDRENFYGFRQAGINRLSIGIQSFCNHQLKQLGRAHDQDDAIKAIDIARTTGFHNINLDLMHGLPNQSIDEALDDLQQAITFKPEHLSWYQLTLEPNTPFYHQPPTLPQDDIMAEMQLQGQQLLKQAGFQHYEVSAFAQKNYMCRHNLNYWQFGDYVGIGAGAHSKLTDIHSQNVFRWSTIKYPNLYINSSNRIINKYRLSTNDLSFEFMLNHLRLHQAISIELFIQRTGLPIDNIYHILNQAVDDQLLEYNKQSITPTALGKRFLNDLIALFL